MRLASSWWWTSESYFKPNMWTRRADRPKMIARIFFVICVSYFLVIISSNRHSIEVSGRSNNLNVDNNQVPVQFQELDMKYFKDLTQDVEPILEPKRILYWTPYYDRKDMVFGFGQQPFIDAGCKITNCWATDDRSLQNQSDAILFHAPQLNLSDVPETRLPHQRYIFYLYETLPNSRDAVFFSHAVDHFFNWTMTHRRDSDIYIAEPYGAIRRKKSSPFIEQLPPYLAPGKRPPAPAKLLEPVKNHPRLSKKNKLIAWFCSNELTHGKRGDYIRKLGQFIPLDIYGKCGNMTCLPVNSPQCNNLLDAYKFYLSAENSLCADYITEKFYRALGTDIIPVVYGGADYAAYAPPHSYIHVADFASPQDLAQYLHLLDKNEALYLKYFEWKKDYEVVNRPLNGWCDLCEKLNNPQEPAKSHADIGQWWHDDVPCYPGANFLNSLN